MDLEDIMQSKMSDRKKQILYNTAYMGTLMTTANQQFSNKTETDSQIQRTNQGLPVKRGKAGGTRQMQGIKRLKTTMYKITKLQGYILYNIGNTASIL